MNPGFTSGLPGAVAAPASPVLARLGRAIEAVRSEAQRIKDEQRPQPLEGGGYSRPDPDELARAAALEDAARFLNDVAGLFTTWSES